MKKQFTHNSIELVSQYFHEFASVLFFILIFVINLVAYNYSIWISFINSFRLGLSLFLFVFIMMFIINYKCKPKECKILHLHKNEICMRNKFNHNKDIKKDFLDDFEIIMNYITNKR